MFAVLLNVVIQMTTSALYVEGRLRYTCCVTLKSPRVSCINIAANLRLCFKARPIFVDGKRPRGRHSNHFYITVVWKSQRQKWLTNLSWHQSWNKADLLETSCCEDGGIIHIKQSNAWQSPFTLNIWMLLPTDYFIILPTTVLMQH